MKQFAGASLLVAAASAASSSCLYCRNQDNNAGFLVSYSYCKQTDDCLKDAWNYINRECLSTWERGNSYSLEACEPEDITCPDFVSSPEQYQQYKNTTWSMAEGSKCNVRLDATEGVARVIFSGNLFLGIEYEAKVNDIITIENGVEDITIYNAAESGPITFTISFSGASALTSAAASLLAIAALAAF